MTKIILLLKLLLSPVWWPYVQSICWCFRFVGPVCIMICQLIVHLLVHCTK